MSVRDWTEELFEEVFHGADTLGTAKFVDDDRHVGSSRSELLKELRNWTPG